MNDTNDTNDTSPSFERHILREERTRNDGTTWVQLEIRLHGGRLSICGSAGYILTHAQARQQAHEFWASYWDEISEDERKEHRERLGCRNGNGFARRVLAADGDYHGLDVERETENDVYVLHSCGQIRDELAEWFPEAEPLFAWHLNDMRPDCVHQEQAVKDGRAEYKLSEPCEVCGYRYGHAWTERVLPPEIVTLAQTLLADECVYARPSGRLMPPPTRR